jgi:hypothetical protein
MMPRAEFLWALKNTLEVVAMVILFGVAVTYGIVSWLIIQHDSSSPSIGGAEIGSPNRAIGGYYF